MVSSLKINMQKSEIIPIGGVEDVDRAAALFGCRVRKLPTTYLGLPLGAPHKSSRVWNVVDERFKRKLAAWKKNISQREEDLPLLSALFQTSQSILCCFL